MIMAMPWDSMLEDIIREMNMFYMSEELSCTKRIHVISVISVMARLMTAVTLMITITMMRVLLWSIRDVTMMHCI